MKLNYTFSRERFFPGFDGEYCKMYPAMVCADNGNAFLFYTMLKLSGSDTVHDSYSSISVDGGKTFNQPKTKYYKHLDALFQFRQREQRCMAFF